MSKSKQLLAALAVAAAAAVFPAGPASAVAAPAPDRAAAVPAPGTQVGSEGVRAQPRADGIIAILIGCSGAGRGRAARARDSRLRRASGPADCGR